MTILSIDIDYSKVVNEYAKHNRLSIDKLLSDSRMKEDVLIKRTLMYATYKTIIEDIRQAKRKGVNINISNRTIFTEIGKIFNLHFSNVRRNVFLCKKNYNTYNRYIKSLKIDC